jgi:DNA polymerase-3 subunit delta'
MIKDNNNLEIILPKNQLRLFGYECYFNSFISLFQKNKLPNAILLSGPEGSGKATFAYHFINYLLSHNEKNEYSVENFTINPDNKSYKNLFNNTHPNFSLLENDRFGEDIKIDNVRKTLKFLGKSTYTSDTKIILIDSIDRLNVYSSNALLKALEEANNKTFFFIINNNSYKILNTIKSRCIEFKIFFTLSEKKKIFNNIIRQYLNDFDLTKIDECFYFASTGNILKYLWILNISNIDLLKDKLSCILYLIDNYKQKNDPQLLTFISLLIELFYNELSVKNNNKLNLYFLNKSKLIKQIYDTKKFNLDKKNLLISILGTLENESS